MSTLLCNAPFCQNTRNPNHAWCGKHRWEREKYKVSCYREILPLWAAKRCIKHGLIKFKDTYINPCNNAKRCLICIPSIKVCPKKQKQYNQKSDLRRKNWRLKKRYGISIEQFNLILQSQNNSCAIWKHPLASFQNS